MVTMCHGLALLTRVSMEELVAIWDSFHSNAAALLDSLESLVKRVSTALCITTH